MTIFGRHTLPVKIQSLKSDSSLYFTGVEYLLKVLQQRTTNRMQRCSLQGAGEDVVALKQLCENWASQFNQNLWATQYSSCVSMGGPFCQHALRIVRKASFNVDVLLTWVLTCQSQQPWWRNSFEKAKLSLWYLYNNLFLSLLLSLSLCLFSGIQDPLRSMFGQACSLYGCLALDLMYLHSATLQQLCCGT